jgi:hypothetical protein
MLQLKRQQRARNRSVFQVLGHHCTVKCIYFQIQTQGLVKTAIILKVLFVQIGIGDLIEMKKEKCQK